MQNSLPVVNQPGRSAWKWTARDTIRTTVLGWFVVCWFIGFARSDEDLDPFFRRAWPAADQFTKVEDTIYEARSADGAVLGYVGTASAGGYGGPLDVAVAVDPQGTALSLAVVTHRETPSFFKRVLDGRILQRLVGKKFDDPIVLGEDVDGVTGATYTTLALTQAVCAAVKRVAETQLNLPVEQPERRIVFGIPEVVLIVLFTLAVTSRRVPALKARRQLIRWVTLITGLVALGFVYNTPFVLAHLNMLMVGYWPEWRSHLFWYILIVGLLLFKATEEWNVYCYDFCPFGAAQDVIAKVGGAGARTVRWPGLLLWSQRGVCIAAISLALIFRNPGASSFEIFGTMFKLNGSSWQFVLLAIIVLSSLFGIRPWCRHVCPLHKNTTEGLFDNSRKMFRMIWQNLRPKPRT